MATTNRRIDPQTRDYVLDRGSPAQDDGNASEIVLRLATRRGSMRVPGLESFGSRLHEVDRGATAADRKAQAFALEALRPMTQRGAFRSLSVTATVDVDALNLVVRHVDADGAARTTNFSYTARS